MQRLCLALVLFARLAHADDPDPLYACHAPSPNAKLRVNFKPDAPITDIVTWVMGFTCKNIIFSSDVAKHATHVTVMSPGDMTPKQAMQLFVDAMDAVDLVVVQKPDTILIKLGPNAPRNCPDIAQAPAPAPAPSPADDIDAQLDATVVHVDETHAVVAAAIVDKLLADPMPFAKGARVVPAVKDGKPAGLKLYAIRPSSLYARINLMNGDTVVAINGYDVSSADKALEAYTKLRTAKQVVLSIERRGKPLTLYVDIK